MKNNRILIFALIVALLNTVNCYAANSMDFVSADLEDYEGLDVEILSAKKESSTYSITGQVVNNSDYIYHQISLEIVLYDGDKQEIDKFTSIICDDEWLEPGKKETFEENIQQDEPIASVTINVIDAEKEEVGEDKLFIKDDEWIATPSSTTFIKYSKQLTTIPKKDYILIADDGVIPIKNGIGEIINGIKAEEPKNYSLSIKGGVKIHDISELEYDLGEPDLKKMSFEYLQTSGFSLNQTIQTLSIKNCVILYDYVNLSTNEKIYKNMRGIIVNGTGNLYGYASNLPLDYEGNFEFSLTGYVPMDEIDGDIEWGELSYETDDENPLMIENGLQEIIIKENRSGLLLYETTNDTGESSYKLIPIVEGKGTIQIQDMNINEIKQELNKFKFIGFTPVDVYCDYTYSIDESIELTALSFDELLSKYKYDIGVTIADDGSYLICDTNEEDVEDYNNARALDTIKSINKALLLPDSLYQKMLKTTPLQGTQKQSFDNVNVYWSYNSKTGMEVLYEKK